MSREYCFACIRKHLGQAHALFDEFLSGDYDVHFWYAIGHMAEAESECIGEYPEFAAKIRKERTKTIEEEEYMPDIGKLIALATKLAIKESQ